VGRCVVVHGRRALKRRSGGVHGVHETHAVGGQTVTLGKGEAAGSGLPRAEKFETLLLLVTAEDKIFHGYSLLKVKKFPATANQSRGELVVVKAEVDFVSGKGTALLAVSRGDLTVLALLARGFAGLVLELAVVTFVAVATVAGGNKLAVHASRAHRTLGRAVILLLAV
jgi:hypothetical protein